MSIFKVRLPHDRGMGSETETTGTAEVDPTTSQPAESTVAPEASSNLPVPENVIPTVQAEPEHFVPDPSYKGVAPSVEAYAAARAALAAKLIGARYGEAADDYLEHVRLAVHAMNEDVIPPDNAVQVIPPAPMTVVVPVTIPAPAVADEPPRRRRRPVLMIGLGGAFIVAALLMAFSFMGGPAPTPTATPSPSWGPYGFTTMAPVVTPTPSITKAPTKAPTKRPVVVATRRPTARPTVRITPTPRPLFVTWVYANVSTTSQSFRVQTLPGASCYLMRRRTTNFGAHSATVVANSSGYADFGNWNNYTWTLGTTYPIRATCSLGGVTVTGDTSKRIAA